MREMREERRERRAERGARCVALLRSLCRAMLMRQAAADVGERQVVNERVNGVRKEGRKQRASFIHALARPHTAIRSAAASASAAACEVKEN